MKRFCSRTIYDNCSHILQLRKQSGIPERREEREKIEYDSFGYADPGDTCYVLGVSGSRTRFLYPIQGGYKLAWCITKELNNATKNSNTVKNSSGTSSASKAGASVSSKDNSTTPTNTLFSPLKTQLISSSYCTTNGFYCDYEADSGTPLYAPNKGTTYYYQAVSSQQGQTKLASYANYIEFYSSDGQWKILCAHLSKFNGVNSTFTASWSYPCGYRDGYSCQHLEMGHKNCNAKNIIGWTGETGNASGPHLHIEVYKNVNGNWIAQNPANTFSAW